MPYRQTASAMIRQALPATATSGQLRGASGPRPDGELGIQPRMSVRFAHFSAVNFDGHLVINEFFSPTKTPSSLRTVTITSRPARNGSGSTPS